MWIQLLLAFAPDLETLLNSVLGVANKAQDTHRAKAGELAGKASELQRQSDDHLIKANQAAAIINKLQGIFN